MDQMKELIALLEGSNLSEISIADNDYKITLKKDKLSSVSPPPEKVSDHSHTQTPSGTAPDETSKRGGKAEGAAPTEPESTTVSITSPIVGTFYRSSSPNDPPYVEVGDKVNPGQTVCVVEAMKVMNEVKADQAGKVVEICVEDGAPVEYGEELFTIAPEENVEE